MPSEPTRVEGMRDLARLPWFDVVDGMLRRDPATGPAVDVHTHLALAYAATGRVNLARRTARVEHYLPADGAVDVDVYANRNFRPRELARMRRDLSLRSVTGGGMRATHTLGNLAREMEALAIVASVLLPIDLPVLSDNAGRYLRASAADPRFVAFGSVHPYAPSPLRRLARQQARGARGLKIHPAIQHVPPDDPRVLRLCRACGERGLPVLFHCGPTGIGPRSGERLCAVRYYRKPIQALPETTFILGHSGALECDAAIELARAFPNVILEISCQSLTNVRKIVTRVAPDRVLYGTDWPFYPQALALAKVLIATDGDPALRRSVLYENAARLLDLPFHAVAPAPIARSGD